MNILIVYAHLEEKSFTAALRRRAVETLTAIGHEVRVADLYAERFCPVPDPAQFTKRADPDHFELMREQEHANAFGTLPSAIRLEQERLAWATAVIFQFPLWWWSMPAILKGWVDQVLSNGFAYGSHTLAGKSAMLCLTAETRASRFAPDAENSVLESLERGIFGFCEMRVLPSFVAPEINGVGEEIRHAYLDQLAEHLLGTLPALGGEERQAIATGSLIP